MYSAIVPVGVIQWDPSIPLEDIPIFITNSFQTQMNFFEFVLFAEKKYNI